MDADVTEGGAPTAVPAVEIHQPSESRIPPRNGAFRADRPMTAEDRPTRTLRVVIEGRPPTPNDRADWRQKARETKTWRETARAAAEAALATAGRAMVAYQVNVAAKTAKKPKLVTRHRDPRPMRFVSRLEVVVVVPTLADRDWDNLVASTKPLTDGLVEAGVMVGDSTRVIDSAGRVVLIDHQRGQSRVIYVIEEGYGPGWTDIWAGAEGGA